MQDLLGQRNTNSVSKPFPKVVADIARLHCDDFDDSKTTVEYSRTRKYMSVTVEVIARSKEQLDDLYRAYTSNPMVKIVL